MFQNVNISDTEVKNHGYLNVLGNMTLSSGSFTVTFKYSIHRHNTIHNIAKLIMICSSILSIFLTPTLSTELIVHRWHCMYFSDCIRNNNRYTSPVQHFQF